MAIGDVIARLAVSLSLDTAAFEKGATIAEKQVAKTAKSFEAMGRRVSDLGQKLTIGISAPIAVFAKKSVDGFIAQEKAMADVRAALKSMGGASGKTAEELLKASDALELKSLYDGDQILKDVTANLLTFGNVSGEVFDRAQQAALDMATRLQVGPKDAAIQLGKALNDPIKGITALGRSGIQFSEKQKALIKSLVETGRTAEAQTLILAELEKQFGGAAEAAADASPWRKAQVAIGQAMDVIGGAILPIIKPVADAIASLARAFASLPEPIQKAVVVAAALGAALGPVLLVLGPLIGKMAPFLATLKLIGAQAGVMAALRAGLIGLVSAFGPIALAAGAVYIAWKNWDQIEPKLRPLIDQLTAIGEGMGLVEQKAGATRAELEKDEGWRTVGRGLKDFSAGAQAVADGIDAFLADWTKFWRVDLPNAVNAGATAAKKYVADLVNAIGQWMGSRLDAIWNSAVKKVETVKRAFFNLYDAVVGNSYIPDMVVEVGQHMAKLDQLMVDPAAKATKKTEEAFRDLAANVSGLLDRLFPQAAALKALRDDLATIDAGEAAGQISPELAAEARFRLRREQRGDDGEYQLPGDFAGPIGNATPIDLKPIETGLDRAIAKARELADTIRNVAADAFAELGYQIRGVLVGAQSLGDALKNVLASLAEMAFNQAWRSLGQGIGLPGFATGTISAPRGFAVVGERGPELVRFRGGERVYNHLDTRSMMGGAAGGWSGDMHVHAPDANSFMRSERQVMRGLSRRMGR